MTSRVTAHFAGRVAATAAPIHRILSRSKGTLLFLALVGSASCAAAQSATSDRSTEGAWAISDTTDNNTGEREVYAFQMYFPKYDTDYVTLRLGCYEGKPRFVIQWLADVFPARGVISLSPVGADETNPNEFSHVFQKNNDPVERGLFASIEDSAKIITEIGKAARVTITAHLQYGPRSVTMDVAGTDLAWARVVRHCPIQKLPRPPI